jgi:hypothetical protein
MSIPGLPEKAAQSLEQGHQPWWTEMCSLPPAGPWYMHTAYTMHPEHGWWLSLWLVARKSLGSAAESAVDIIAANNSSGASVERSSILLSTG